ncbi:MAG TPA: hypothetical protein PKA77_01320 [Chitinophagaceae bacterium]|nr:hypothetical protein [Chitinophagaceae bacterium]HMU58275.1 hypothetical protein [Chitinophagaceae bacterium]
MKADEFLSKFKENSEYKQMLKIKESEGIKKTLEIRNIEKPFIESLHKEGYKKISDSDDILKLDKVDSRLTDIILNWLIQLDNKHNSQETLVRALGKAEFPFDGTVLMRLFESQESSANLKWAIANTVAVGRAMNISEWLKEKLTADEQPKENEMLVYAALKYFEKEKTMELLLPIFDKHPLQVADALTIIGNTNTLVFLQKKIMGYKGQIKSQIEKSVKRLKNKIDR